MKSIIPHDQTFPQLLHLHTEQWRLARLNTFEVELVVGAVVFVTEICNGVSDLIALMICLLKVFFNHWEHFQVFVRGLDSLFFFARGQTDEGWFNHFVYVVKDTLQFDFQLPCLGNFYFQKAQIFPSVCLPYDFKHGSALADLTQ